MHDSINFVGFNCVTSLRKEKVWLSSRRSAEIGPLRHRLSSMTINRINYLSQFWTWQAAKRRCSRAPRTAGFRSARWTEAAARDTRRKPAPWRGPSTNRGGTWTCWNRTWCSWCDWTSASRAAVSNTVYFFALRRLRGFTVLLNKWTLSSRRRYVCASSFNEHVRRIAHSVKIPISVSQKLTLDDLKLSIQRGK